jgi:predicted Zn finger-like uncharacterized protein
MYTRCPKCSTCFRVTDRHLSLAKGKVRCGQCRLIFNAPEHAIDDLPVKTVATEAKATKTTTTTPVAKKEKNVKPAKAKKPEAPVVNKTKMATPAIKTPQFDADATVLADVTSTKNDKPNKINPDALAEKQDDIEFINDDEIFDESFDLDAAINELTQATEDAKDIIGIEEEPEVIKPEKYIPTEENSDNIFTTDTYAATSATSVADIMNEMEKQLSLDISEPDNNDEYNDEYNADNEFDFIELSDELEESEKQEDYKNENENENIEEDAVVIVQEDDENGNIKEDEVTTVDADELFDQVDLSDFQGDDSKEDIVVDDDEQKITVVEVPLQLRNDIERLQAAPTRLKHPLLGFPFLIFLLVLSFSQLAYFRAHDLVNLIPSTRPLLEKFCDTVSCFYSGPSDTKQIELLSRDVRLHPKEKKALLISASIINNANFAQPYPNIHIRLSDISGNVVAERIFSAKTYMGKLNNPFLLMKSKTPVHINFEVVDPGKDAINFEFSFL